MSTRIRLFAGAVLIAAIAVSLLAFREYRKQLREADHNYSELVRLQDRTVAARKAIISLEEAEILEQNYVLTGETVYLEGFKRSVGEWQDEMGVLEAQTGKGALAASVQEISAAGERAVAELAAIVALYDGGSRDKALDRIRKSTAIVYLDQVRQLMAAMQEMDDQDVSRSEYRFRPVFSLNRMGMSVAGLLCLTLVSTALLLAKVR